MKAGPEIHALKMAANAAVDSMNDLAFQLRRALPAHDGKRNPTKNAWTSIAKGNRVTGRPHEHRRAIARRQRQIAAGTLRVSA